MKESLVNKTSVWISSALSSFAQIRRRGTPSNIMDVVLAFAPSLQEAIDLDAHWSGVARVSTDQTDLAISMSVQVLRTGVATLWRLAMEEDSFLQIRSACAAQPRTYEILYPHCAKHEWINELFLTEAASSSLEFKESLIAPNPHCDQIGVIHVDNSRESRGGYSVYVPENYNPAVGSPLIVSLHGGSGHGRGQVWMWLREARSHGVVVHCPTSLSSTWNLGNPESDTFNILSQIEAINENWNIDTSRLMLHGISDGGTYALASGLLEGSKFTHLVPCFPSFHPLLIELSSQTRLERVRIYLIHGALDWLFPVEVSRQAYKRLQRAGVDIVYREIEDLSHSYPNEENESILQWYRESDYSSTEDEQDTVELHSFPGRVRTDNMDRRIELPLGHKSFSLVLRANDDLELYVDNCLRKRDKANGSRVLYVWTNVELHWEEHRFVEARFDRQSRRLHVTVNREEVLSDEFV